MGWEVKLKPCPFCSGSAKIKDIGGEYSNAIVGCVECEVNIYESTIAEAIIHWNTRVEPKNKENKRAKRTLTEKWMDIVRDELKSAYVHIRKIERKLEDACVHPVAVELEQSHKEQGHTLGKKRRMRSSDNAGRGEK